ncbi:energy transducer TonB [Altererythrobacter lutimaris]|uniref:Energy transducer TonB n=1 Tax=Altererythrobacter lutimaris TaxID=2743979 RepID=A0A850HEF6_9SPHN|nr:energy transducer TonB [Altererythrobacter lutimaris]NVE95466.1 energy transducer TonB [Altererythrobacter lutimaris]
MLRPHKAFGLALSASLIAAHVPLAAQDSDAETASQVSEEDVNYFAADRFEPTSKWRLSRKGPGCTIRRDFAHADGRQATLTWQRVHPGWTVQVGLFGDGIARMRGTLETQFVPASGFAEHGYVANASLGEKPGVAFATLLFAETGKLKDAVERAMQRADLENQSTHYVIIGASQKPIALHTGSVAVALATLDKCAREELDALGPFIGIRSSAQPVDQAEWARKLHANYPSRALRSGWSGPVPVRLIVNEEGRAERCDTLHQLAAKPLQEAACHDLLEHSRFEPAKGANGNPMKGIYITSVVYRLSGRPPVDAHGLLHRKPKEGRKGPRKLAPETPAD